MPCQGIWNRILKRLGDEIEFERRMLAIILESIVLEAVENPHDHDHTKLIELASSPTLNLEELIKEARALPVGAHHLHLADAPRLELPEPRVEPLAALPSADTANLYRSLRGYE